MRLEDGEYAAEIAEFGGRERGADLGGMMAVVVDHRDTARLAASLESAIDAGVGSDPLTNRIERDVEFQADGDGRGGVQHVVHAWNAQVKFAEIVATARTENRLSKAPHSASTICSAAWWLRP